MCLIVYYETVHPFAVPIAISSAESNAVVDALNFKVFPDTVANPFNMTSAESLVNGHADKSMFALIPLITPVIVDSFEV